MTKHANTQHHETFGAWWQEFMATHPDASKYLAADLPVAQAIAELAWQYSRSHLTADEKRAIREEELPVTVTFPSLMPITEHVISAEQLKEMLQ